MWCLDDIGIAGIGLRRLLGEESMIQLSRVGWKVLSSPVKTEPLKIVLLLLLLFGCYFVWLFGCFCRLL